MAQTSKQKIKIGLTRLLSDRRQGVTARAGAHAARLFLEMYENHNYEYDSNGESWLLRQVAKADPRCVFDVGANVGDWTLDARRAMPQSDIHSFELVPGTAAALAGRFAQDRKVLINKTGLLDMPGTVRVKHYPGFPAASSVNDFPHNLPYEWLDAACTTGDLYCSAADVEHIDLLKIDAEGSDHKVLQGFSGMLERGAVDIVQFEYGRAAIHNKFLLADFYTLLQDVAMVVGKLYPTHVEFRDYNIYTDENFLGPNYVAVRADRADLRRLLSPS